MICNDENPMIFSIKSTDGGTVYAISACKGTKFLSSKETYNKGDHNHVEKVYRKGLDEMHVSDVKKVIQPLKEDDDWSVRSIISDIKGLFSLYHLVSFSLIPRSAFLSIKILRGLLLN